MSFSGSDSVRNKTYKKVTAYLVLQCILLLEAIILLSIEHKTKADIYENGEENFANQKNTLREEIENLETKKDGLQQENNNANKQKQQLKEEEKALLKHLHGMGNLDLHLNYAIFSFKKMCKLSLVSFG